MEDKTGCQEQDYAIHIPRKYPAQARRTRNIPLQGRGGMPVFW